MRRFTLPQVFAFSLALLIVNGAYLAAFAHASIFYEANVLLHLGLGLVLAGAAVRYLPRYSRECGAFLACAVPAVYLAIGGNTFEHRWALWLHVGVAVLAVSLIAARGFRQPLGQSPGKQLALALGVLLVLPASTAIYRRVL